MRRLLNDQIHDTLQEYCEVHPCSAAVHSKTRQLVMDGASQLDVQSLALMSPYAKNDKGQWENTTQSKVLNEINYVQQSFIDKTLWSKLFSAVTQPDLVSYKDGYLEEMVNTAVPHSHKLPSVYYKEMSTAVLVRIMSGSTNDSAKRLNTLRAGAWMTQDIANDPVYAANTQVMLGKVWAEDHERFSDYIEDQTTMTAEKDNDMKKIHQYLLDDLDNIIGDDSETQRLKQGAYTFCDGLS